MNMIQHRSYLVDDTCKYVSTHPVKSLDFALVAGFLISRLIRQGLMASRASCGPPKNRSLFLRKNQNRLSFKKTV